MIHRKPAQGSRFPVLYHLVLALPLVSSCAPSWSEIRPLQLDAWLVYFDSQRGLAELQRDFKILPIGVAQTGAWRYSFIYELVHRYYPDLPEQARPITHRAARQKLVGLYLDSVGAATAADARRLFQWKPKEVERTLEALVDSGDLHTGYSLEGRAGEHFVTAALFV